MAKPVESFEVRVGGYEGDSVVDCEGRQHRIGHEWTGDVVLLDETSEHFGISVGRLGDPATGPPATQSKCIIVPTWPRLILGTATVMVVCLDQV